MYYMLYCRKKGSENAIARDYVLPDYTHIKRGYVRTAGDNKPASGTEQVVANEINKCYQQMVLSR